jgi:hypothetical protein
MFRLTGNRNLIGIASLCLGVLIFSSRDATIKAVSQDYAVTQAIVTRSIVAFPILLLFIHWESGIRSSLCSRC